MNELKTYRVICDDCDGNGELFVKNITGIPSRYLDHEWIMRDGNISVICFTCNGAGILYVDWLDFLKTKKINKIYE